MFVVLYPDVVLASRTAMGGVYLDHHSHSDGRDLYSSSYPGDSNHDNRLTNVDVSTKHACLRNRQASFVC